VQEALVRFEPRIEVTKVEVTVDARQLSRLLINIAYRVRRTDTLFNLVYPFYLERGEL
jgi:phage baseplate assembly protein W